MEALKRTSRIGVILLSVVLVVQLGTRGFAQRERDRSETMSAADADLAPLLQRWNQRELRMDKGEFDFEKALQELREGKPNDWPEKRLRLWNSLPDRLEPRIRLSRASELLLVSMYSENVADFREREPAAMRDHTLRMKLYLVLSLAQQAATRTENEQVLPSHVFVAIARAWTGLWPISQKHTFRSTRLSHDRKGIRKHEVEPA